MSTRDVRYCCFSKGRVLLLSLTRACNQGCLHCMRSATIGAAGAVDIAVFEKALKDAIVRVTPDRIVISGGEPTLVPNLPDVISAVSLKGYTSTICTNATLIQADAAHELARRGVVKATVGIEGVGADYDYFRNTKSMFPRAVRGIEALLSAGIHVTINLTLWNRLIEDSRPIAFFLNTYPFESVSVTVPLVQGRARLNERVFRELNPMSVARFVQELASLVKVPIDLRIPECRSVTCPSGKSVHTLLFGQRLQGCLDANAITAFECYQGADYAEC